MGYMMQTIKRISRHKPDMMTPLIGQLCKSISLQGASTLSSTYLQKYLHITNGEPTIVFWNGSTDLTIIKLLGLTGIIKYLNIMAYSDKNNDEFNLKLRNIKSKEVLYSGYVETVSKKMAGCQIYWRYTV